MMRLGDDALDLVADERLDVRDHRRERVPVVGGSRQRIRREYELGRPSSQSICRCAHSRPSRSS